MKKKSGMVSEGNAPAIVDERILISDLRDLIQAARQRIAVVACSTQTMLCWYLGRRLLEENLQGSRAACGKRILVTVSRELTAEYGRGFSYAEIARMIQFSQLFPEEAIVVTLSQQLSWSHFHALLPIKNPLARDFYTEMCRIERWDVRTLRRKIGGMLFERTALSKKTESVIATELAKLRDGQMSPDTVFRDPNLLDLLGLQGAYSERDLESAILREIEGVLLEQSWNPLNPPMSARWSSTCAGWTRTSVRQVRKPRSDSSCAPPPTPSKSNSSSWMPSPSASANT